MATLFLFPCSSSLLYLYFIVSIFLVPNVHLFSIPMFPVPTVPLFPVPTVLLFPNPYFCVLVKPLFHSPYIAHAYCIPVPQSICSPSLLYLCFPLVILPIPQASLTPSYCPWPHHAIAADQPQLKANNGLQTSGWVIKDFFCFKRNAWHLWTAFTWHHLNDITHQQVMRFNQWSKFATVS